MSTSTKIITTQDYEDVAAVARTYLDGLRDGDSKGAARAFHKDATIFGMTQHPLLPVGGPISNLYATMDAGDMADIRPRVDILDITPTAAVVRADIESPKRGFAYRDFLALVKIDGSWTIVNKIYHEYIL